MNLLLAGTFTASLAKLTGDEQKAVKTTAFDLQLSPANPGMQFHKLEKAKDRNFWAIRVSGHLGPVGPPGCPPETRGRGARNRSKSPLSYSQQRL